MVQAEMKWEDVAKPLYVSVSSITMKLSRDCTGRAGFGGQAMLSWVARIVLANDALKKTVSK